MDVRVGLGVDQIRGKWKRVKLLTQHREVGLTNSTLGPDKEVRGRDVGQIEVEKIRTEDLDSSQMGENDGENRFNGRWKVLIQGCLQCWNTSLHLQTLGLPSGLLFLSRIRFDLIFSHPSSLVVRESFDYVGGMYTHDTSYSSLISSTYLSPFSESKFLY